MNLSRSLSKSSGSVVSRLVPGMVCAALLPGLLAGTGPVLRLRALAHQAAPLLAVLAGGKLTVVQDGVPTAIAPVAVQGTSQPMAVTAFEWSASGLYLGWQQVGRTNSTGAAGWYDTATHRRIWWRLQYQYGDGWSVTSSGVASLAPGENLGSPATLTRYNVLGAVTHRSVRVQTSDNVAGYSGGFIVGPDIVSGTRMWRVSLSGAVAELKALPKPAGNGPPYEVTAASPDGKVFAAELGDHTDGCGVGPASRIFVVDEATGKVSQASLPSGPRWRVLSFVFDPQGTLDATMVDCTQKVTMATTVVSVSPSGAVAALEHGALVATSADGQRAYQAGHVHLGGTEAPELEEVATGPLTVSGRPVRDVRQASTVSWAP